MVQKTERITSRDNTRLVAARKTRDGKNSGRIFIEGRRLVEEALRSEIDVDEIFVADNFRSDCLLERISERAGSIAELSEKLFTTIADTNNPQGIIVIANRPDSTKEALDRSASKTNRHFILLKEINNPSNLGAILRTAEAAGIAGIIVSTKSADVFSAKSIRASMGACFRVPVWENADFDEALEWANGKDLVPTASDISAATSYADIDWRQPRLVVFGSEAHGLESGELDKISEKIRIPMDNDVESLNLAVSAGIVLFEAKRQRA